MQLRYGVNPHQVPARVEAVRPGTAPLRVLAGHPSYINILDAVNASALVTEAAASLGLPAAISFKHVSPAGAALAGAVDDVTRETFGVPRGDVGATASAYLRARDADPRASYGDMVAVSEPVDAELAELLRPLPSDGIVAPGYEPGTVELLAAKKGGRFLVLEADRARPPSGDEVREIAGLRLVQPPDTAPLTRDMLVARATACGVHLPETATRDLLLGLITVRCTQSNSVGYLRDGAALGIAAGQQSRIDGTRLAGRKADTWWLRRHPRIRALDFTDELRASERTNWRLRVIEGDLDDRERAQLDAVTRGGWAPLGAAERSAWLARLDGVALVSDGAFPFRDNIDQAARHRVRYVAEPGGSIRSADVADACREHGMLRIDGTPRLFRH